MQHHHAPTQYQFQNPGISKQQSYNNVQIPWQNYAQNPQTHLQMQQPCMKNQQVPITYTQEALTQNPMHTNPTADQSWNYTKPRKV